jgi:phage terminase large subunit-like protein
LEKKFPGLVIGGDGTGKTWAGTTWMNDSLTADYLKRVIGGAGPFGKERMLIWDAFSSHKSESTKKVLKGLKLESAIIPGGCTKYIQASSQSSN